MATDVCVVLSIASCDTVELSSPCMDCACCHALCGVCILNCECVRAAMIVCTLIAMGGQGLRNDAIASSKIVLIYVVCCAAPRICVCVCVGLLLFHMTLVD